MIIILTIILTSLIAMIVGGQIVSHRAALARKAQLNRFMVLDASAALHAGVCDMAHAQSLAIAAVNMMGCTSNPASMAELMLLKSEKMAQQSWEQAQQAMDDLLKLIKTAPTEWKERSQSNQELLDCLKLYRDTTEMNWKEYRRLEARKEREDQTVRGHRCVQKGA